MTNKCEKIVINELLCFIQCKIEVLDEDNLIQICESHFSESEIENAKEIIFQSRSQSQPRCGDGKGKRLLQDIIRIFKEEPAQLSIFVAKDLNRLPPVTCDHVDVSSLLKQILVLKKDVHNIQRDYVKTADLEEIKNLKVIPTSTTSQSLGATPTMKKTSKKKYFSKITNDGSKNNLKVVAKNHNATIVGDCKKPANRPSKAPQARPPLPTSRFVLTEDDFYENMFDVEDRSHFETDDDFFNF